MAGGGERRMDAVLARNGYLGAAAGVAQLRARAGQCPPLQWDPRLAASAAATGRRWPHGPHAAFTARQPSGPTRKSLDGQPRRFFAEQMVGAWIAERRDFRPGVFPNVSRTGNWSESPTTPADLEGHDAGRLRGPSDLAVGLSDLPLLPAGQYRRPYLP